MPMRHSYGMHRSGYGQCLPAYTAEFLSRAGIDVVYEEGFAGWGPVWALRIAMWYGEHEACIATLRHALQDIVFREAILAMIDAEVEEELSRFRRF